MSGNLERIQEVRDFAEQVAHVSNLTTSLSLIDDVRDWLASDPRTLKEKFIDDIWKNAKKLKTSTDWRVLARMARAARNAGRFYCAQYYFDSVITIIEEWRKTHALSDNMCDVYAEFAESRVYLGYTDDAIRLLNRIPDKQRNAWHHWVWAFALHQNAFVSQWKFAKADPPDVLGLEKDYMLSNDQIDLALAATDPYDLKGGARYDIWLLRAANHGARARLQKPGADKDAADALRTFMDVDSGAPGVNKEWSVHKEKRGRFCLKYKKKIDGEKDDDGYDIVPSVVEEWRETYRRHYFKNLRAAGLTSAISKPKPDHPDGDIDSDEDYGDDEP
jgi:hypothetical protein